MAGRKWTLHSIEWSRTAPFRKVLKYQEGRQFVGKRLQYSRQGSEEYTASVSKTLTQTMPKGVGRNIGEMDIMVPLQLWWTEWFNHDSIHLAAEKWNPLMMMTSIKTDYGIIQGKSKKSSKHIQASVCYNLPRRTFGNHTYNRNWSQIWINPFKKSPFVWGRFRVLSALVAHKFGTCVGIYWPESVIWNWTLCNWKKDIGGRRKEILWLWMW